MIRKRERMARVAVLVVLGALLAASPPPTVQADEKYDSGPCGAIAVFVQTGLTGQWAGDSDIGAQRLSTRGEQLWNEGERSSVVAGASTLERAPFALADGSGGAFVVFEGVARAGERAGNADIFAQRIDGKGNGTWEEGKRSVVVASSGWSEHRPLAVPDGAGGLIVVFEEHAPAGRHAGDIDVGAQRISPDGELLWNEGTKSSTVSSSSTLEQAPVAIPDGSGGAFVVFEGVAATGDRAGNYDILAQRIDANGKALWNDGERSVVVASSGWNERNPVVVPDGAGGIIVIFEEHAVSGQYAGDVDVAAQRVSADGRLLWNEGTKSSSVSSGTVLEQAPAAIPDGSGGAFVVFEMVYRQGEHAGDHDIMAQRIDANGKGQWNEGEVPIGVARSRWSERRPVVVSDAAGGFIAVYEEHAPAGDHAGDVDIGAQRVSGAAGERLWEEGRRSAVVSSGAALEEQPFAIPDGRGGTVVAFHARPRDGGSAADYEVYAQWLDDEGARRWSDGESPMPVASSRWSETVPVLVSVKP